MSLRVLFIGGNGIISSASRARLVERGDDLTLLNRGRNTDRPPIEGARHLLGDADDEQHAECHGSSRDGWVCASRPSLGRRPIVHRGGLELHPAEPAR